MLQHRIMHLHIHPVLHYINLLLLGLQVHMDNYLWYTQAFPHTFHLLSTGCLYYIMLLKFQLSSSRILPELQPSQERMSMHWEVLLTCCKSLYILWLWSFLGFFLLPEDMRILFRIFPLQKSLQSYLLCRVLPDTELHRYLSHNLSHKPSLPV